MPFLLLQFFEGLIRMAANMVRCHRRCRRRGRLPRASAKPYQQQACQADRQIAVPSCIVLWHFSCHA